MALFPILIDDTTTALGDAVYTSYILGSKEANALYHAQHTVPYIARVLLAHRLAGIAQE